MMLRLERGLDHPIIGYGLGSRIRALREFIPSKFWIDGDGIEHVEVNFYVRGPQGAGKVYAEMFRDKDDADKSWKYKSLVVQTTFPSDSLLILESNSLVTYVILYLLKIITY